MRNSRITATIVLAFALLVTMPAMAQVINDPPLPEPRTGLQITTFPDVCDGCMYYRSQVLTQRSRLERMPTVPSEGEFGSRSAGGTQTGYVETQAGGFLGAFAGTRQGYTDGTAFTNAIGTGAAMVGSGLGGSAASPVLVSERKIRSVIRKLD
jgi:hypothetical protein